MLVTTTLLGVGTALVFLAVLLVMAMLAPSFGTRTPNFLPAALILFGAGVAAIYYAGTI